VRVVAPLDDIGSWSSEDVAEVARLIDRIDGADASRWELGDFLCQRCPVGDMPGRKTGTGPRLAELAERVGISVSHLRGLRDTSWSWPPETRVPAAAHYVHSAFRDRGREWAPWRRDQLLGMEHNVRGRVTSTALRRWRKEQEPTRTRGPEHRPRAARVPMPLVPAADLPDAVRELIGRCNVAIEDAGRLQLHGDLPLRVTSSLDRLCVAIADVRAALAGA
jgi:hypothetical protein